MELVYFVDMDSDPVIRIWSGRGDQVFGGNTYKGSGQIFRVGAFEVTRGVPVNRMDIEISVLNQTRLTAMLQYQPPFDVTVRYVARRTRGSNWVELPHRYRGKASQPTIRGGKLTLELETYLGDVDRGDVLYWSHEDQEARYPGDKGLEYMRALEDEDVSTTWPP